jgi:hypothetical protein
MFHTPRSRNFLNELNLEEFNHQKTICIPSIFERTQTRFEYLKKNPMAGRNKTPVNLTVLKNLNNNSLN